MVTKEFRTAPIGCPRSDPSIVGVSTVLELGKKFSCRKERVSS